MREDREHIIKLCATVNIFCAVDCDTFETAQAISEDIQGKLKGRTNIGIELIDSHISEIFTEIQNVTQQDIFCPDFWKNRKA